MTKRMINKKIEELVVILCIGFTYVFGTLFVTKTIFSGYHLVDDHEIIRYVYNFQNDNIFCGEKILSGFPWIDDRFRPLYMFIRKVRSFLFGTNYYEWYFAVGIEIVLCIVLSYYFARMYGCNKVIATLFGLVTITGEQSAVWWRLGPQEPMGLLLLLTAIILLNLYQKTDKKVFAFVSIISTVLCSWTKESFTIAVLIIPFLGITYRVFIDKNDNIYKAILESLQKNLHSIICALLIFLLDIYVIVSKVGTTFAGYAGIEKNWNIKEYLITIYKMLIGNLKIYFVVCAFLIILCIIELFREVRKNKKNKKRTIVFFLLLLVSACNIGMQLLLYAKSGMWERYLIPSSFSWGTICIILTYLLFMERKTFINIFTLTLAMYVGILWFCFTYPSGCEFAQNGFDYNDCFKTINEEVEIEDEIVVSLDLELNYSVETYCENYMSYHNVYSYLEETGLTQWLGSSEIKIKDINESKYILCKNNLEFEDYTVIKSWKFGKLLKKKG